MKIHFLSSKMKFITFILCLSSLTFFGVCVIQAQDKDSGAQDVIGSSLAKSQEETGGHPEIAFIAAGISNGRQQFGCVQAHVEFQENTPKEFFEMLKSSRKRNIELPSQDQERKITALWSLSGEKMDIQIQFLLPTPPPINSLHLSLDKEDERTIHVYKDGQDVEDNMPFYKGAIASMGSGTKDGVIKSYGYMDPRYYVYYRGEIPLDKLLLRKTGVERFDRMPPPIYKGEETIDGSQCMIVEIVPSDESKWIYWVDIDHNFMVRRSETYVKVKGKIAKASEVQCAKPQKIGDAWLFTNIESRDALQASAASELSPPLIIRHVTISELQSDCDVIDREFKWMWPVGSQITDTINGQTLVAILTEQKSLSALNKLRATRKQSELIGREVEGKELEMLNATRKRQGRPESHTLVVVVVDSEDYSFLNSLRTPIQIPNAVE